MNQNSNFTIIVSCILAYSLILGGCSGNTSLVSGPVPISSRTPSQTKTSIPSPTVEITATPTFNNKTFIITPDALFSSLGLKSLNTPTSQSFCEHIPPPEVVENPDELSRLVGRFSLCPSISWPLVNTAMDLDKGSMVSVDDESSDIAMEYAHVTTDGVISYYVRGLNNSHIDEIDTNILNYRYCENLLSALSENDRGILNVHEGATACVITTEGRIALLRVEHIYPLDTQGVEFSFAVLKE